MPLFDARVGVLLALSLVGCSGTRLYERANTAASADDLERAIAYDALAARDRPAQPPGFEAAYQDHVSAYEQRLLGELGAPTPENADAQASAVRGFLAWARSEKIESAALPAASARLGELARLRFERVRTLVASGRVDEGVVLGRALLVDTPSSAPERRELGDLERRARAVHEAEVLRLAAGPNHEAAVALHERLARQMGGVATAVGVRAEATLARRTGMTSTVDAAFAGACAPAVERLKSLLPSGGDTPARFTFKFSRCAETPVTSARESVRETPVDYETTESVSDLVPTYDCHSVSTGFATICDGRGRNGCHQEETSGQKCDSGLRVVERSERVRRTRIVQTRYLIHSLELVLDYDVTLSSDVDGEHLEVDSHSRATSGRITQDDTPPSTSAARSEALADLTRRLDGFTRALATFARKTQGNRLAREGIAAADPDQAQALFVEASVVLGAATAQLRPAGVSVEQLDAAIANRPWELTDGVGPAPRFPAIAEAEVLEDAHERTNAMTLSADARAGASGGAVGGVSRYVGPTANDSTTGGFVGALATGAQGVGTRFTSAGGSFHLFGNFDSGTASFDASFDLGLGLKLGNVYLLPVGGGAIGTSTHAVPTNDNFRPNAALRANAFDAVYGGQVTIALPYPLNMTINSQLVRTAPVPFDDLKQWTTRLHVLVGYHFSKDVAVLLFGRYWELDTKSVGPLDFFGGDGHDHRLMTVGIGIGGTNEKFIDTFFGSKKD